MENLNDPKPDLLSSTGLQVDEQSGIHLKDAGTWAKTIAVILCIICGLAIIAIGFFGTLFNESAFTYGDGSYIAGLIFGILIIAGLAALFVINLFRFSSGMFHGITNQDEAGFDKGITGLRNYFILSGVLALIFSLFYLVKLIS